MCSRYCTWSHYSRLISQQDGNIRWQPEGNAELSGLCPNLTTPSSSNSSIVLLNQPSVCGRFGIILAKYALKQITTVERRDLYSTEIILFVYLEPASHLRAALTHLFNVRMHIIQLLKYANSMQIKSEHRIIIRTNRWMKELKFYSLTCLTSLNALSKLSLMAKLLFSISPRRFLRDLKLLSTKNVDKAFRASTIS